MNHDLIFSDKGLGLKPAWDSRFGSDSLLTAPVRVSTLIEDGWSRLYLKLWESVPALALSWERRLLFWLHFVSVGAVPTLKWKSLLKSQLLFDIVGPVFDSKMWLGLALEPNSTESALFFLLFNLWTVRMPTILFKIIEYRPHTCSSLWTFVSIELLSFQLKSSQSGRSVSAQIHPN